MKCLTCLTWLGRAHCPKTALIFGRSVRLPVTMFVTALSQALYGTFLSLGEASCSAVGGFLVLQQSKPDSRSPEIFAPYDVNVDGNLTDRLNGRAGFSEVGKNEVIFEFANPSSQLSALGNDGAVGRNTFRAPGIATMDLAISKRFRFTENQTLEFRAEFFNLFNRTHFGIPVHQVDFPGFGRSFSTVVPARIIQFALKYSLGQLTHGTAKKFIKTRVTVSSADRHSCSGNLRPARRKLNDQPGSAKLER